MTVFEKDNSLHRPFTWGWVVRDGKTMPKVVCKCGEKGVLDNHEIGGDGAVTPSFHHDVASCGFHDMIKLEGYKETDHARNN